MRISDWSSDVCSSDLLIVLIAGGRGVRGAEDEAPEQVHHVDGALGVENLAAVGDVVFRAARLQRHIVAAEQAVGNDARRGVGWQADGIADAQREDRKSTRLNSSH